MTAPIIARLRGRLILAGYTLGWALARTIPERLALRLFTVGADIAWRRDGKGVRRLRSNLRHVPGVDPASVDALTRRAMRSYARYWLECFRLPAYSRDRICDGMHMVDRGILDEALASGRGVVVALAHLGNWDHAGAWLVHQGISFTTVAERLEPAELFDKFVAYRAALGMEVLATTGEATPPFETLTQRLRAGKVICLLSDRDLSRRGVEVDYLSGRTRMAPGPAALAVRTGAVLLPVTLWFDGAGWGARIHPEVAPDRVPGQPLIATMTQRLANVFAAAVIENPEDWHMLARVFLDDTGAAPARNS